MVASAWYRATTVESEDDPDVVSITDAEREGYKTIRLAPPGAKKCQNPLFCDVPAHFIGIYGLFIKTM
jgi:hypothetical protein